MVLNWSFLKIFAIIRPSPGISSHISTPKPQRGKYLPSTNHPLPRKVGLATHGFNNRAETQVSGAVQEAFHRTQDQGQHFES